MRWHALAIASALLVATQAQAADKKYGPGASDTEIKLGQTSPFSGPASAYSVIAKTQAAYFKMINEQGGVNGRKVNLITLDDAYSPPKTVEQTRKLVEQEEVAVILNPLGTPTGLAVRKYILKRALENVLPRDVVSDVDHETRKRLLIFSTVAVREEVVATVEEAPPKVVNLMDALRQSLDRVSTGKKKAAKADMTADEKPERVAPKKRAAR